MLALDISLRANVDHYTPVGDRRTRRSEPTIHLLQGREGATMVLGVHLLGVHRFGSPVDLLDKFVAYQRSIRQHIIYRWIDLEIDVLLNRLVTVE